MNTTSYRYTSQGMLEEWERRFIPGQYDAHTDSVDFNEAIEEMGLRKASRMMRETREEQA